MEGRRYPDNAGMPVQLSVRIRPQRIAVLVAEASGTHGFMKAVDFLSRVWGGKHGHIIAVSETSDSHKQADEQLALLRPEIVMFVDLDGRQWAERSACICQPRACATLDDATIQSLDEANPLQLIHAHCILHGEYERRRDAIRGNLILWELDESHPWFAFMGATFGLLPLRAAGKYDFLNARLESLNGTEVTDYLTACLKTKGSWCWLDFASSRLSIYHFDDPFFVAAPTVVVCNDNSVADLALYWNLRMTVGVGFSKKIVLFPEAKADDAVAIDALAQWVTGCAVDANFVQVISRTCRCSLLRSLAIALRHRLVASQYKFVELPQPPWIRNSLAFEDERQITGSYNGSYVAFEAPRPACVSSISGGDVWICDLLKDVERGRAPGDLVLPPTKAAFEIINAPFPPHIPGTLLIGRGVDSINRSCNTQLHTVRLGLPTNTEMLEGRLLDRGFEIEKDEKRIRYEQTLLMFSELNTAARVVSGAFGRAVNALAGNTEPLSFGEISTAVGRLDEQPESQIDWVLNQFTHGHMRRIGKERFRRYYEKEVGRSDSIKGLLSELCRLNVLEHRWRFRCKRCDKTYWPRRINFEQVTRCPGCKERVIFEDRVKLGYELNELFALAIREGWGPVIQTGRFLYNLTRRGFMWLPGVKCRKESTRIDFDVMSLCDGHLVAAECKTLRNQADDADWDNITGQLCREAEGALMAGVELFVIASHVDEYPHAVQDAVARGANIPLLWLDHKDLEDGRRRGKKDRHYLDIDDFVPHTIPSVAQSRRPRKRKQPKTERYAVVGLGKHIH